MTFKYPDAFTLESGVVLPGLHLAYTTYGTLNESGDNVVWVFHALTANSDPLDWWPGLVGPGRLFDPLEYFIVCVNMPGSCYGSISPLDLRQGSNTPWYHEFPFFTPRDMARAYQPLRRSLGIHRIHTGIGGSMGGQQLLEWAILEPSLFRHIIPIATNAQHSPWGIAFNTAQRMAIDADPSFRSRHPEGGLDGMRAARATALLSYRHYEAYKRQQPRGENYLDESTHPTSAASYQRYQGEKLARRFNAFSYYALSLSMDAHDVGRNRGGIEAALRLITASTLVIGITSDILFPPGEQQQLASLIPDARFRQISSLYGHDGFLLEYTQIETLIKDFYTTVTPQQFEFQRDEKT